jgi:hypothetical protein
MTHPPLRRVLALAQVAAPLVAAAALSATAAAAQECPVQWQRAVACVVELQLARAGERAQELRRDELSIRVGEAVELEATARDQWGRHFPAQRMAWGIETDRGCRDDQLAIEELGEGRFRLRAGSRRGRCDLLLWVPGNLNLDRRLRVEVVSAFREGYERREAEQVAGALYRGILGREPDPEGLRQAIAEIQRGRLESQVRGMCNSPEFRNQRQGLAPSSFLEELYQGLFQRPVDSGGARTYLRDLERGRCTEVVLSLVRSEEFEARLLR